MFKHWKHNECPEWLFFFCSCSLNLFFLDSWQMNSWLVTILRPSVLSFSFSLVRVRNSNSFPVTFLPCLMFVVVCLIVIYVCVGQQISQSFTINIVYFHSHFYVLAMMMIMIATMNSGKLKKTTRIHNRKK